MLEFSSNVDQQRAAAVTLAGIFATGVKSGTNQVVVHVDAIGICEAVATFGLRS